MEVDIMNSIWVQEVICEIKREEYYEMACEEYELEDYRNYKKDSSGLEYVCDDEKEEYKLKYPKCKLNIQIEDPFTTNYIIIYGKIDSMLLTKVKWWKEIRELDRIYLRPEDQQEVYNKMKKLFPKKYGEINYIRMGNAFQ